VEYTIEIVSCDVIHLLIFVMIGTDINSNIKVLPQKFESL
jgi:hypothetical protein